VRIASYRKLLSPKRKLFYGLFAFGPGTVLGLYLYSVQRRMERENEALRLEHVKTELGVVQNQQDKDEALANAIQEMRDRLRRLEEEANVSREKAAKVASASAVDSKAAKKEMPVEAQAATDSKIEAALAVLKSKEQPDEQKKEAASPAWMTSSLDGSQGYVAGGYSGVYCQED
jgi:hypothetical protein